MFFPSGLYSEWTLLRSEKAVSFVVVSKCCLLSPTDPSLPLCSSYVLDMLCVTQFVASQCYFKCGGETNYSKWEWNEFFCECTFYATLVFRYSVCWEWGILVHLSAPIYSCTSSSLLKLSKPIAWYITAYRSRENWYLIHTLWMLPKLEGKLVFLLRWDLVWAQETCQPVWAAWIALLLWLP